MSKKIKQLTTEEAVALRKQQPIFAFEVNSQGIPTVKAIDYVTVCHLDDYVYFCFEDKDVA